jgi:hypothetical protein
LWLDIGIGGSRGQRPVESPPVIEKRTAPIRPS